MGQSETKDPYLRLAELAGDVLRECGVLVLVFGILDIVLAHAQGKASEELGPLLFCIGGGIGLVVSGMLTEFFRLRSAPS